ncbi:hypothetical protein [Rhodococcus sp. NPDC060176]|uniref:hypothetical protein n=1 Tax=Rhodococcus sp. NPDC060176 TaxID=3347062 RepID=UPI0036600D45
MKIPTNLSLDDYRRVNESTMARRGKRWTELSMAEAQEILDEMNGEIVVLEATIVVLEAQKNL